MNPLRTVWSGIVVGLVVMVAVSASGCGKPKIHGKVTLDDEPVKEGMISFTPVNGQGQTGGAAIKDGEYTAELQPGNMRIEIRSPKVVRQRKAFDTPESPLVDVYAETIPAQYNEKTKLEPRGAVGRR